MMGGRRSRIWRTRSIAQRLTLLFGVATFAILLASATVLYWSLARSLRSEDERLLEENARLLLSTLELPADRESMLREEIALEPTALRLEPFYARVVDAGGATLLETPGMADVLPSSVFAERRGAATSWRSPDGRTYLMLSRPVPDGTRRSVHASLDVTQDALILRRYGQVLFAVLLIATLLATLVGRLIARRGLAPLGAISSTVKRITARRLDRRIGGDDWPEELADLAAMFDQMLDRLEESFSRLSRFSADLAHELRTPLTNLRGEAEITLTRARTAEEYRLVLESSLEEYERLTELIDRLLFLARADSGAAALQREDVEVRDEVSEILDFYAALSADGGVSLECTGKGRARVDPTLFRRAIANLLSNSLAHTPRGGKVSVNIEPLGEALRVQVCDTGCGIGPEHLHRVRDRFYRVDSARTGNGDGAGLGLSLVATIAELHGGSMELSSRSGQGTTVALTFPAG